MIYLYSGTPGSGKSYHSTYDIYKKLNRNKKKKNKFVHRVISNYGLAVDDENFLFLDNSEITTEFLYDFARKHHLPRVEGQTLVVIDEAQILFNSRDWNTNSSFQSGIKKDSRMDWIKFFSQHRKFGFNVILVAQNDRMLDRQIRSLVEYEIAHMKMNNYFLILPFTVFLAVTRWYGQKMKLDHEMILYRPKIANLYDSYGFFENETTQKERSECGFGTREGCSAGFPAETETAGAPQLLDVSIQENEVIDENI